MDDRQAILARRKMFVDAALAAMGSATLVAACAAQPCLSVAAPIDPAQPGTPEGGAADPNAAEPDAAEPDAAEPNAAQPDAAEPDATEPDAAQPD